MLENEVLRRSQSFVGECCSNLAFCCSVDMTIDMSLEVSRSLETDKNFGETCLDLIRFPITIDVLKCLDRPK